MTEQLYQTIPHADGTIQQGLFPTIDWFNAIAKHIDFKNQVMLDLGCCNFSYGIQALQLGARQVVGLDNSKQRVEESLNLITEHQYQYKTLVLDADVNIYQPALKYDIILFSMLIHWLEDAPSVITRLAERCRKHLVFVYRLPKDYEKEPGYRPTVNELSSLLGLTPIASEKLMDTEAQQVQMVIYDKNLQ